MSSGSILALARRHMVIGLASYDHGLHLHAIQSQSDGIETSGNPALSPSSSASRVADM